MKDRRKRWLHIAVIALLVSTWGLMSWAPIFALENSIPSAKPVSVAAQGDAVARMVVFHSASCASCVEIVEDFLPAFGAKYGASVEIYLFDISEPGNMPFLAALEKAYGVPVDRATIPEIFIGNDVFLGAEAIVHGLEEVIDAYLAKGGVDLTPLMIELMAARQPVEGAVVHGVMFWMTTCGHCHNIVDHYLPLLQQRYGDSLRLKLINVDSSARYERFVRFVEQLLGEKILLGVPAMVIGKEVMVGSYEIPQQADSLVQRYLSEGGVDYPPELPAALDGPLYQLGMTSDKIPLQPVPTPAATPTTTAKPIIHLAYFEQPGCPECDRVGIALNYMQSRYPQLHVTTFDVKQYADLNEWLGQRAGVPESKRLIAPAVFVGQKALVDRDIHLDSLEALINAHEASGAPPVWEEYQEGEGSEGIISRFRSLGVLTVLGAGLIDGLNPCAFATMIFFVSYLALSGRKGREILAVGAAFTLGVFLTYLAVGLGMWRLLGSLGFLSLLSRWIYGITALLCVILAVLSISDYIKARKGQAGDMTLSLPKALRKRINALIRNTQSARAFVAIAFVTGIAISLIELACTGQVYLPTIIFVLSVPELQSRAFFYLLLYNILFILPLVVIFFLAYLGTTGNQFNVFLRKHTANIKLATALLFVVLAAWLVSSLL